MEQHFGGSGNILQKALSLPRIAREAGMSAVNAVKDAVSAEHHLEVIIEADENLRLASAEQVREIAGRMGDRELFDLQTLHMATIYARSLCRHIEKGRDSRIVFSLTNLKENLQLLGIPDNISWLGLSEEQVKTITPYLGLPEIAEE